MAQPRFGTDGIRGRAPEDLTVELAVGVGSATAQVLTPVQVLIGRDTRASGPALVDGLTQGLTSQGIDVVDLGVIPTPGVAYLSASLGCPGIVVSASHNPASDNGIKVLGAGGTKLSVREERAIETALEASQPGPQRTSSIGALRRDDALVTRYLEHLVGTIDGTLQGMTVALDCAHGASVTTARTVFEQLGANVVVIGETPDGANINDGVGSTHPEALADLVRASKADIGLAFDGDADRVVAVDHTGVVVDGDTVLALFAHDLQQRGQLHESTVVVTVMSNLGFHRAMANADIAVRTVAVGDRNVVEALDAGGLSLGGEQSGHIIFRSLATTGDGVLSGLLLADLVKRSGTTLAVLSDVMLQRVPQYLEAVRVQPGSKLEGATELNDRIDALQRDLGDRGRILVRASGTEPVIRVMVEADDDQEARQLTKELVDLVQLTMGTPA